MATSKKNAKTNKTAHVLNMITGGQASDEPTAHGSPAVGPAPSSVRGAVTPILEVARANDDALSSAIQNALTEELKAEEVADMTGPEEMPQPAAEEPQPVMEEPQPAVEEPESISRSACNASSEYYNVIQAIVEEKALKYMQMMDMCQCPRCQADVKALALSNLTPKYIVMDRCQATPMLSVYEGKYGAAITAQLISACLTVKDHPRH